MSRLTRCCRRLCCLYQSRWHLCHLLGWNEEGLALSWPPRDTISSGTGLDEEHTQSKVSSRSTWDGSPASIWALQQPWLFPSFEEQQAGDVPRTPGLLTPPLSLQAGSESVVWLCIFSQTSWQHQESPVWVSPTPADVSTWCYGCAISTAHLKSASSHTSPRCWSSQLWPSDMKVRKLRFVSEPPSWQLWLGDCCWGHEGEAHTPRVDLIILIITSWAQTSCFYVRQAEVTFLGKFYTCCFRQYLLAWNSTIHRTSKPPACSKRV